MKITMHNVREVLYLNKKDHSRITHIALNVLLLTNS